MVAPPTELDPTAKIQGPCGAVARAAIPTRPPKLRILEAEARLEEADARWQECLGVHAAARTMWETLVRRAYVARELVLDRSVLTAAQALEAQLRAGLADRQATAQLLGCVDSGAHPHAHAVALVQALEYQCRQLDPPPPASPPPPRPGTVRLRCTKTFHDPDGGLGIVRRPGEIFDTREDFVRELRAQDLAVEVEG